MMIGYIVQGNQARRRHVRVVQEKGFTSDSPPRDRPGEGSGEDAARQETEPAPGEAETISRINGLCRTARISAEAVARYRASGLPPNQFDRHEHDRYKKLRAEAAGLGDTLTDHFCRSVAAEMLTGLCMTAGDVEAGRALFELIEIDPLKAKALKEFPALGQGEN